MAPPESEALSPAPDARHVLEPGCDRCPELVACRERLAWGNGSLDADVAAVGEALASVS